MENYLKVRKVSTNMFCPICDSAYVTEEIYLEGAFMHRGTPNYDGLFCYCDNCKKLLKNLIGKEELPMDKYTGYWDFSPMDTATTYTVEARNFEDAEEKLTEWAFAHKSYVNNPMDFELTKQNPRYFVDEDGEEYDENQLHIYWEMYCSEIEESSGAKTFSEYLNNCLSKNGSLKEVK